MNIEIGDIWRDSKSSNPRLYFISNIFGLDDYETVEGIDIQDGQILEQEREVFTDLVFRRGEVNNLNHYLFHLRG
jgi:hypothetical protein